MIDVPARAPELRPGMPRSMWSRLEAYRPAESELLARAEELAAKITAALASGDNSQLLQLQVEFDELVP